MLSILFFLSFHIFHTFRIGSIFYLARTILFFIIIYLFLAYLLSLSILPSIYFYLTFYLFISNILSIYFYLTFYLFLSSILSVYFLSNFLSIYIIYIFTCDVFISNPILFDNSKFNVLNLKIFKLYSITRSNRKWITRCILYSNIILRMYYTKYIQ